MNEKIIVASNPYPEYFEFKNLMKKLDEYLNADVLRREEYYQRRRDRQLEEDVFESLKICAQGTSFQGSIELVSGKHFPDIVAHRFYGVEVKSTQGNKWTSIGSSILESTRIQDVERIFLTFGKMGNPIQFCSRPYEECMKGIAVTHYPRYQIDMTLGIGDTIFDKMGIDYNVLRQMEDPIPPVAEYLKRNLTKGQRLWWAGNQVADQAPVILRLWTTLSKEEKGRYTAMGCALYPEILGSSNDKYHNFSLWLVTDCSIVNNNVRDLFSAGGTTQINGLRLPAVFKRMQEYKDLIKQIITDTQEEILMESWGVSSIDGDRFTQWMSIAAMYATQQNGYDQLKNLEILQEIFD